MYNNDDDDDSTENEPVGGSESIPDKTAAASQLLLTATAAAEMLCVSQATLSELVKRDRLRCVEFVASGFHRPIRRFRLKDIVQFIEEAAG